MDEIEGQEGARKVDDGEMALYVHAHSLSAVYVPAEFNLSLMKLFVFMTSCRPRELKET